MITITIAAPKPLKAPQKRLLIKLGLKALSALCGYALLFSLAFALAGVLVMVITAPDNPSDWVKQDFILQAQIGYAFIAAMVFAALMLLLEKIGRDINEPK